MLSSAGSRSNGDLAVAAALASAKTSPNAAVPIRHMPVELLNRTTGATVRQRASPRWCKIVTARTGCARARPFAVRDQTLSLYAQYSALLDGVLDQLVADGSLPEGL